jgi:hypothetical protein
MKKKNGPSAGIPRPSGERSSPVGNGNAAREVRICSSSFLFFLFFFFLFCFLLVFTTSSYVSSFDYFPPSLGDHDPGPSPVQIFPDLAQDPEMAGFHNKPALPPPNPPPPTPGKKLAASCRT